MHPRGIFRAASSGNGGVSTPFGVEYPAADPSVFAAGSINPADRIARHTERGSLLDILAPGETVPIPYRDLEGAHTILTGTGTSFASPIIAGAAAILKQIDPNVSPRDIISILRASGSDNYDGDGEAGPTTGLIFPRLDLDNAITLALHPLSGASALDEFNSAFGRLAVTCTRATHALLLVSRPGLDELLAVAPPRPGTPLGEPGTRQLPRQTHQRILATFARGTWSRG